LGSPRVANRAADLKRSEIRRFSAIVQQMGGVNLSQGVCDQPAPDPVKDGAKQAIDDNHSIYTDLRGLADLRQAVAEKSRRFNGLTLDPETQIVVTCGTAGGFICAALATLNPGDEVICFSPFYNYYPDALRLLDVTTRFVDTHPPDWTFATDDLARAFSDRTRMILVNTPCNPTGKVFTESELHAIANLADSHDAWIFADEIYEYITFDRPHVSIARLPAARERTLTASGPSKTFAVTGWRVGWVTGPAPVMEKLGIINDMINICAPAPLQHGVRAGLTLPEEYYRDLAQDYRGRRDLLADALADVGLNTHRPQGAIYITAEFKEGRFTSDVEAAETILEKVGVATVPLRAFFANPEAGARFLRFCFAKPREELEEACRRLRRL
jgi:aminotransferase